MSVKFPSLEHIGSPPATDKFLDGTTVTIERLGRNGSVPGDDESWMDGLSAAEVIRQYGMDPNVFLTPEGKLETPNGAEYIHVPSDGSDCSSILDGSSTGSLESDRDAIDGRKLLNMKLTAKIKKRAQARERGATPALNKAGL